MGFSLDVATSAREDASNIVTEENSAEIVLDMEIDRNKKDDEDREEGEIIEDTPVEYEDISSDEEVNLRQRIQELEARNIELEKIASISSAKATLDYAKDHIPFQNKGQTFINLVDDDEDDDDNDNDNIERKISPMPSINDRHYCYRKQRRSLKLSKSTKRDRSSSIRHERRHSRCRRHAHRNSANNKQIKKESSKPHRINKPTLSIDRDYSSEDENALLLDREKLRAALRRDIPHSKSSTTTSLRKKLKVVKQTVAEVIDNDDIDEEEVKSNKEIFELLDSIVDNSEPQGGTDKETDIEDETISLEEQELRLIALKSAIVKKHEARKKRKVIEARPYSPTDTDITMEEFNSKLSNASYVQDEPDVCVISPIPSSPPLSFDKSLLPVDMDIVCSEASQSPIFFNEMPSQIMNHNPHHHSHTNEIGPWIPITDIPLPNDHHNIVLANDTHHLAAVFKSTLQPVMMMVPDEVESPKSPEDVEMGDTNYLPDKIDSPKSDLLPDNNMPIENNTEKNVLPKQEDDSHQDDEEEHALRALLIANLGSPKNSKRKLRIIDEDQPPKTDNNQNNSFSTLTSSSALTTVHRHKNSVTTNENQHINSAAMLTHPPTSSSMINNCLSLSPLAPTFVPIILQKENREIINIPNITMNLKEAVKRIKTKYTTKANQKQTNNVGNHHHLHQVKQLGMTHNNRNDGKNSNLIVVNLNSKQPPAIAEQQNLNKNIEIEKSKPNVVEIKTKSLTDNKPAAINDVSLTVPTIEVKNAEDVIQPAKKLPILSTHVTNPQIKEVTLLVSKPDVIVDCKPLPVSAQTKKPEKTLAATIKPPASSVPVKNSVNNILKKRPMKPLSVSSAKKAKIITNPQAKQVKKLVIQLQNSDTDTETDVDDELSTLSAVNIITENDRYFDNTSPSSIAMDSPSCGPCSPVSLNTATELNEETTENSVLTSPAFEQKLDEFLKKVRTKQENENETKTQLNSKKVITTPKKLTNTITTTTKLSGKPVTPLAVRHLPASAQLEYRTLVTRMRNLEKQKTIRQQTSRPSVKNLNQPKSSKLEVIPFTVTIPNDQANVNNADDNSNAKIGDLKITLNNTGDRLIQTCTTNNSTSTTNNIIPTSVKADSLMKQVLVKNVSIKVQQQNALALQQKKQKQQLQDTKINNDATKTEILNSIPVKMKKKQIIISNENSKSNIPKRLQLPSNVEKMADEDKKNLLKTAEKNYIQHSSILMNEIENMHSLVSSARTAKQKQIDLEIEYDSLKLRMQEIEEKLNGQKSIISKLYPNISASHKTVLNNRQQSVLLSSYCVKLGKIVSGDEYKIPNDNNKVAIVEKLKVIAMDTKLLKTMKKSLPPNNADNTSDIQLTRKLSNETPHELVANEDKSDQISIESKAEKANDALNDSTTQATEIDDIPKTTSDDIGDTTHVGKYRSPLDHMQNESTQNPDAILCPFQLMGQCEDKECLYKHLK